MTGTDVYFLTEPAAAKLARKGAGGLTARLSEPGEPHPFTVLDCFDQSLRHSRRLLIETAGTIELLTVTGPVAAQPGRNRAGFVRDFPQGPVRDALADLSPLRSLLPVGTGNLRRAVLALLDDEGKTRCRAHLYYLSDTGGETAVLAALQGLRGYDRSLAQLRRRIEDLGGTALGQGGLYARLFPGHPDYQAKPKVAIGHDEPAHDAATAIVAAHLPVARANEPGVIADHDTEFLHDYRIALRKIRSVLSLFKGVYDSGQTDKLKAAFSALMTPTGRLRDLDVYLLERQRFYDLLPDALHGGLDKLFAMFAEERAEQHAALSAWLAGKAYRKDMETLEKLFARPRKLKRGPAAKLGAHDYACTLIWKRYRTICKTAQSIGPDTEDAAIHELRIHCKKLRYLMEFFEPVFPAREFRSLVKPLKRLQDSLGLFNDYSVQQQSLSDFLRGLVARPGDDALDVAQSVGALITVLHQRQIEERARVLDAFARFNSERTQATFRHLFHARKDKP